MGPKRGVIGLYADADVIGGAERSMLHLARAHAGGAELVVCSGSEAVLAEAERLVPDIARHRIDPGSSLATTVRAHRRAFTSLGLDLLQVTLCNPFAARPAQLAAFSARIPTVAVEQLALPSRSWRGASLKWLWSLPLAGHVAVGTASADDLARWYRRPRSGITVVHNGVPDRAVVAERIAPGPVIGCAARLEAQKNLHVLVAALPDLPDVTLALIGEGSLRADLAAQADELGVADRVRFLGWVDDPRALVAGFDLFVLPSREESFPLSIVEAMLSGVPVVASDVGSVADAVVSEHTGLLVPPGDAAALAAAVRRLLADTPLRARLAGAARARAEEHFTDVVMARRYGELWSRVLSGRRRRSR